MGPCFSTPLRPLPPASFFLPPGSALSPPRGFIYSTTADFGHDAVPTSRDVLIACGQSIDLQFDATEDSMRFRDAGLSSCRTTRSS